MLSGVPLVPGRNKNLSMLIERIFTLDWLELNIGADFGTLPAMLELARHGNVAAVNTAAPARQHVAGAPASGPALCCRVSLCGQITTPQMSA